MPVTSKFGLVLLATTALMVSGSISNAQTSSGKYPGQQNSTITAPVADPTLRADPGMAKVLACPK
jgi:hypothetical protein